MQRTRVFPSVSQAGVCLHITSLPGDYGIGEIGREAFRFLDLMAEAGLRVWQVLPVGPTAYGDSPYQSLSSFAANELLLGTAELIELGLLSADEAVPLTRLSRHKVDYGAVVSFKWELLNLAAGRFQDRATSEMKSRFDEFQARNHGWLDHYAVYRIVKRHRNEQSWNIWPGEFGSPDSPGVRKLAGSRRDEIMAIKVLQFLFDLQWQQLRKHAKDRGILLFGDIPIYLPLDCADVWQDKRLVELNETGQPASVAGVPPDFFSENGQLWGNPLYDWQYHESTGFDWWIARLANAIHRHDLVRIDHFRGLESYWSVPATAHTAAGGEWLPGPRDAFLSRVYDALPGAALVAEDLGFESPDVDALRDRYNIPGMKVLQNELSLGPFDPGSVPAHSVCYTGTHDNDTITSWFKGSPQDTRSPEEILDQQAQLLRLTGGSYRTIHTDLIRLMFSTAARLAIIPMQDYLGLGNEARLNFPGTSSGNWAWRLVHDELSRETIDTIGELVEDAGRRAQSR